MCASGWPASRRMRIFRSTFYRQNVCFGCKANIASTQMICSKSPMWRASILVTALYGLCGCSNEQPVGPECPSLLSSWSTPQDGRSAFRPMNVVAFSASGITWNREVLSDKKLREYLAVGRTMNPVPFTVLDPTGAPDCRTATKLRDEINEAADCQGQGVCGQGSLSDWRNAPGLSGPGWIE
jgi:hypothetical protein